MLCRQMYPKYGDLGDVAAAVKRSQTTLLQPTPLTVRGVFSTLHTIASQQGSGANNRRQNLVAGLLRSCAREAETKYLVRTLVQNLRVGAGWRSVLGPLCKAVMVHRSAGNGRRTGGISKGVIDEGVEKVLSAFHVCPNLGLIVKALLEGGPEGIEERCGFTPGVPVKPMLAKPSEGVQEALLNFRGLWEKGTAAAAARGGVGSSNKTSSSSGDGSAAAGVLGVRVSAEWKYDGQRAQIHMLEDKTVRRGLRGGR